MIEHLRGRDRKLENRLGWTGREAEWIALVCLHSGVFHPASILSLLRGAAATRAHRIVKDDNGGTRVRLSKASGM